MALLDPELRNYNQPSVEGENFQDTQTGRFETRNRNAAYFESLDVVAVLLGAVMMLGPLTATVAGFGS